MVSAWIHAQLQSECALGLVIVLIPWLRGDSALSFPASYLFVAVFLLAPLTAAAYREPSAAAPIPEPASEPLWADLARISMLVVVPGNTVLRNATR